MVGRRCSSLIIACGLGSFVGLAACQVQTSPQVPDGVSGRRSAVTLDLDQPQDYSMAVGTVGKGIETSNPVYEKRMLTAEEMTQLAALKPKDDVVARPNSRPLSPTEETLQWAAAKDPNEIVIFTFGLPERPFRWHDLSGAEGVDRDAVVERRKADLLPFQTPIIDRLRELGADVLGARWLANAIDFRAPAGMAKSLAQWSGILHLQHSVEMLDLGAPGPNEGYYGGDRRLTIHAERLLNNGYTGAKGNAAAPESPVRLGAYMTFMFGGVEDRVPKFHPGFKTSAGVTRFYKYKVCNAFVQNGCTVDADFPTQITHDTVVMGVMAGSIEAGQDSTVPGTNTPDQIDRSGIARDAQLEYYMAGSNTTLAVAIAMQSAINAGVDVLNFSGGWNDPGPTTDYNMMNEQIQNAFSIGNVLMTAAPGDNNGSPFSTTCNQLYPSNRPEVLAVNGLDTVYDGAGNTKSTPLTLQQGAWSTSGCDIAVYDGSQYTTHSNNSVGPLAPGVVGMSYFGSSPTVYGYSTAFPQWGGSSFSAPIVAGAAGLLRDAFYRLGYGVRPNYWLKTDILMLTDGYDFTGYNDGGTGRRRGGTSKYSGTGRLQLRAPTSNSFSNGNWQWTWNTYGFGASGFTLSKTVPGDIENYRMAAFWEETDLTKVADIDVYVDAIDSSGSVCWSGFVSQTDWSIINAIHIKKADLPLCAALGGSLRIRFVAYAMPPGQTRQVWFSDLWDHETAGNGY